MHQETHMQPIPIYREGKLDRKYWYAMQASLYLKEQGRKIVNRTNLIFEDHRLTYN